MLGLNCEAHLFEMPIGSQEGADAGKLS